MNRPSFTKEQEYWLCEALDFWYLEWRNKMTSNSQPHMLGIAKEQLKQILCGQEVDKSIEFIVQGCML